MHHVPGTDRLRSAFRRTGGALARKGLADCSRTCTLSQTANTPAGATPVTNRLAAHRTWLLHSLAARRSRRSQRRRPRPSAHREPRRPGRRSRETCNADEAIALARTAYTSADVQFLQSMIPHHQQAIDMAALAKERTNRKELLDAAGRIDASQKDEIEFMQGWLEERNEQATGATASGDRRSRSAHDRRRAGRRPRRARGRAA